MIKKKFLYSIAVILITACLFSCKAPKELAYFKDLPDDSLVSKLNTSQYEPLKLQANDEVQVTISSTAPEASQFFNLVSVTPSVAANGTNTASQAQGFINLYRVSDKGFITLPVLGDMIAAGSTTEELKLHITQQLKEYLKDAVVTVRLVNFKVTVIGEVGRPVIVPVNGQTINVLEAVGAAGDMTVYGIRKNVRIIRKLPDGTTEIAVLDFSKAGVLQSPYFQLKQNDIIYVQPDKSKSTLGSKAGIWIPIVTSLISVAAIIITRK